MYLYWSVHFHKISVANIALCGLISGPSILTCNQSDGAVGGTVGMNATVET